MIHLPNGEEYLIETLDDLLNRPVNMMDQAVLSVQKIFLQRIEMMEQKQKGVDIKGASINLINDGKKECNIKVTSL